MADTLVIRLAADATGFRDWLLVDEQGRGKGPVQKDVPEPGIISATPAVVILVPGSDVLLCEARVPGRNRKRLLRAIPFALEEQLAEDVEGLHFALGTVQENDLYPVAVVARDRMDAWAALLLDYGIVAERWVPETLAVPLEAEAFSLLLDGENALVRSGPYSGFAADRDWLATVFTMLSAEDQVPARVHLFSSALLDLEGIDIELVDEEQQPLEVLARGCLQHPGINLLQGAYSKREEWSRLLLPWRATAALLVAGFLLASVSMGLDYYRLTQQQQQLTAQIESIYRKTFPGARRIVNPRAQMEQQLRDLQRSSGGGNTEFLALFAETAKIVRATQGINVQGASYRDGRLDLDLLADNLQILDSLKQALVTSGRMDAEIQSATTEAGQKVKSRIRIRGVGS